jgi:two-component system phosphate regulon sensor histidine kinase PhoR
LKYPNTSFKSTVVSLALALGASLLVWAVWNIGLQASLQAAFVLSQTSASELTPPQDWLALMLILSAGTGVGLALERAGARRVLPFVFALLGALCGLSLLASRFLGIDILFAPIALAVLASCVAVQVHRLWIVDRLLTRNVRRGATNFHRLEGDAAQSRLMSGMKLLETVLSIDEAVIFQHDDNGALAPAARLRSANSGALESDRNTTWREGVKACEKAMASGQLIVMGPHSVASVEASAPADSAAATTTVATTATTIASVALPLQHEGVAVGALLLRLRGGFDESDRPLLDGVGAQLARDLQRERARRKMQGKDFLNFLSAGAAANRLESFSVVSGLLTEQRFGAEFVSEAADGYAVAYLDGTLACINAPLLEAARLTAKQARALDLFELLDRFRTGVFDEPAIAVRRVLRTGEAYQCELNFVERNQTFDLRIALAAARNDENGAATQPLCLTVTVRDVTRMKEYDRLKSDMISLMSHELRTPITSINGFAELLVLDETLPAEAREFLTIIRNESQRLSRMINTFLAVTQLQSGDKQEVSKIPLRLDDIVRETITNMQPVAKKKRIRLIEQPSLRLPPVAADKSLITQVVTNLVGNAIKYSPERTAVTISTLLEAEAVRVCVEDRGYGIPLESVDRVWDKFYRVARDGQEKDEESTGLGLSFVREVVEQHGGDVALESEVGRGSKFSFTLPRL